MAGPHTINASVIGLNKGLLHLPVLNQKGITLASLIAKDSGPIKIEIQGLGKCASWVTNEAELIQLAQVHNPRAKAIAANSFELGKSLLR